MNNDDKRDGEVRGFTVWRKNKNELMWNGPDISTTTEFVEASAYQREKEARKLAEKGIVDLDATKRHLVKECERTAEKLQAANAKVERLKLTYGQAFKERNSALAKAEALEKEVERLKEHVLSSYADGIEKGKTDLQEQWAKDLVESMMGGELNKVAERMKAERDASIKRAEAAEAELAILESKASQFDSTLTETMRTRDQAVKDVRVLHTALEHLHGHAYAFMQFPHKDSSGVLMALDLAKEALAQTAAYETEG